MKEEQLPPFLVELQNPEHYNHQVTETRVIQTHISYVMIAGDFVYKFKKPVDFGFLDFTTLEKRGHFCEQELVLNRRLCPDIYLDLVRVNKKNGRYQLDGEGEVVEYGVKMVRMPEEKMMGRLLANSGVTTADIDAIVDVLIPFYQQADGGETIQSFGTAAAVGTNVIENFEQTESFVGSPPLSQEQFDLISAYSRAVLKQEERFTKRIRERRIRDCHGDLYSANICLAENVHIFDCIEFNERFRYSDIAADVAFLAMDLDFHNMSDLSDYFVKRFANKSGDDELTDYIDFYKCYRAYVRGKIGLFTAADTSVSGEAAKHCLSEAEKYFALAERYARKSS